MPGAVSTPRRERDNVLVARSAAETLSEALPEKIAQSVYEFIIGPLPDNPQRVGRPLGPPVAPAYSARRGDHRVLYFIDDATHTVKVTAIRHRADAYRSCTTESNPCHAPTIRAVTFCGRWVALCKPRRVESRFGLTRTASAENGQQFRSRELRPVPVVISTALRRVESSKSPNAENLSRP